MAYFVQAVDRKHMPEGHDWLFFRWDNGDATFIIASDAGPVELDADCLAAVIPLAGEAAGLPVRLEAAS